MPRDKQKNTWMNPALPKDINNTSMKGWVKSQGLCKVVIYKSGESYNYGQNLILFGNLKLPSKAANPGEFDYSQYLKRQKIYAILEVESDANIVLSRMKTRLSLLGPLKTRIFALRKQINRLIHLYLPKQEAGLLSAMMLGLRSEIPSESKDLLSKQAQPIYWP